MCLFPLYSLNSLRRLLNGCQRVSSLDYSIVPTSSSHTTEQKPKIKLDLYFDKRSRDFGLLMDLLAEASGIVQSLRILSMFDRQFQKLWSAANVEIHLDQRLKVAEVDPESGEGEDSSIIVSWGDCLMADYFTHHNPGTVLEYTVEISPETEVAES